jgi:hypothetical protein
MSVVFQSRAVIGQRQRTRKDMACSICAMSGRVSSKPCCVPIHASASGRRTAGVD